MDSPFFSIITCTYNSEQYLNQCIQSVKEQKCGNYEHIIVDAFSTDRTPEIIDSYAKKDSRVRIIEAEPKGISNAMNLGILNSRGKVIQHLHSDDYYFTDQTLSVVYAAFNKYPRKSIVTGVCARDINGSLRSGLLSTSTYHRRKLLLRYLIYVNCYIAHPATFIKKSVFENHGLFDESFKIAMDYEYWLRVIGQESFLLMNRELTVFREHEAAASFSREECLMEENQARRLHKNGFRARIARPFIAKAVEFKEKYNLRKG